MKSVNSGIAGSVRLHQLTRAGITIAEKHGKRLDATGKARPINKDPALTRTGLDLNDLYDAHVKDAFIPAAKTKAMHMILQFPKELVDPNDAAGMLDHARAYAERVFGPDAVFADRIDRDEKNKQVVDVFVAPKYEKRTKKDVKTAVSMTRHLKLLAKKHGHVPHPMGIGRAMQDELFEYFRDVMKLDGVERGAKKVFAGDDWKSAEQQRLEELEEKGRELDKKEADLKAREDQLETDEKAVKKDGVGVSIEATQAKLLFRAADDDQGLALMILETGKPKMNEDAMDEKERLAYRSTWSERMLELARFVAKALQTIREKLATAIKREKAAQEREAATLNAEKAAQQRLDEASAAEEGVMEAKAAAEAFRAAWQQIPEGQRSPPVREAIIRADALLASDKRPAAKPGTNGSPKSAAEAMAALRSLAHGPNDGRADHLGGVLRRTGRGGA